MFKQFLQMLFWKRDMQKHADWFDNHEPAQARFEENEEWLEELEDRVVELENIAHPSKDIEEFESYPRLIETIKQMVKDEIRNKSG